MMTRRNAIQSMEENDGEIHVHCGEVTRPCEQGKLMDDRSQGKHACSQPIWYQES